MRSLVNMCHNNNNNNADYVLWLKTGRRSCESGGQTMARFKPLCATSMPVRILGHSSWSAWLHLQEGSERNVQTSRTQRPGGPRLCVGGNTCGQRTSGSLQGRLQTTRWSDDGDLEKESHSPGTSRLSAPWLSHTLVNGLQMQAQRRKQQPQAKQPNTQVQRGRTSSSRLPSKT